MSAILNSLNTHNFPIFHPILMKLISKFMIYRTLSYKIYLSLGLPSPLTNDVVNFEQPVPDFYLNNIMALLVCLRQAMETHELIYRYATHI